LKRIAT